MAYTPLSHPGPSESQLLIHSDGPLPWIGNPGPEKSRGLLAACPPLSLTVAFLFLDLRFRSTIE